MYKKLLFFLMLLCGSSCKDRIAENLDTTIIEQKDSLVLYVKKDGTGDFMDVQSAINSIKDASKDKIYEVRVCDDFSYTDLTDLWCYYDPETRNTEKNPTQHIAAIISKDYVNVVGWGG